MCKAMDDMMKENYDNGYEEGRKCELKLRQRAEDERQQAELRIKQLEAELERIKGTGKISA